MINKRLINTGVEAAPAAFDPLQNFETVTYTGNGSTQKITGYIRKGGAFNGSSSYIQTSSAHQTTFSLSAWLYADSISEVNWYGSRKDSSNLITIGMDASGKIKVFNKVSNTWSGFTTTSAHITANTWHHVVVNFTSSDTKIYVDGSDISNDHNNHTTSEVYGDSYIGATNTTTIGSHWNGKIDQVRIFDKALSSSEVTTLYGETYASSTKSTTDIFGDGSAVALYELDEDANDTGTTASTVDTVDIFGDSSLTDYYKLDGTLTTEKSGGTALQSGSSTFGDGILGQALYLSGAQTASRTSTLYGSMNITGSYTASFYFKATTISKRNMLWYYESNNGRSNQVEFGSDNKISFGGLVTSSTYLANTWYHLVVSFNSSTNSMVGYINGQSVVSGTPNTGSGSTQCFGHGSVGLTGYIDQVRIFNKVVSASEAAELFEATQYNGTATNVNYLGMAFSPSLVWIKQRSSPAESHALFDIIRGANKSLWSDSDTYERDWTAFSTLNSFDSNGFTLGSDSTQRVNLNGGSYVAWCWKAGGAAVSNTNGSITSQVSANQAAGFSIVKYTGNGSSSATVGHGLSSTPELVIIKNTSDAFSWAVRHSALASTDNVYLNATVEATTVSSTAHGGVGSLTSTTIGFLSGATTLENVNTSSDNYIAYCFHSVDGYQKVGSYSGSNSNLQVTTGFQPRFVLLKNKDAATPWAMFDNLRSGNLYANDSAAESDTASNYISFNSTGFELVGGTGSYINIAGYTWIYLAIA